MDQYQKEFVKSLDNISTNTLYAAGERVLANAEKGINPEENYLKAKLIADYNYERERRNQMEMNYKVYNKENHEYVKIPGTEQDRTSFAMEPLRRTFDEDRYDVVKDTLPPQIRETLEAKYGEIKYVNERESGQGFYAIARNEETDSINFLKVDRSENGINVSSKQFKNIDQAYNLAKECHTNEIEKAIGTIEKQKIGPERKQEMSIDR